MDTDELLELTKKIAPLVGEKKIQDVTQRLTERLSLGEWAQKQLTSHLEQIHKHATGEATQGGQALNKEALLEDVEYCIEFWSDGVATPEDLDAFLTKAGLRVVVEVEDDQTTITATNHGGVGVSMDFFNKTREANEWRWHAEVRSSSELLWNDFLEADDEAALAPLLEAINDALNARLPRMT